MKIPAALGIMASITGLATYIYNNDLTKNQQYQQFNDWITEHGRSYGTQAEYVFRFEQFKKSLTEMEQHNGKNSSYTLGLNQFSDLTKEEFRSRLKANRPNNMKVTSHKDIELGEDNHSTWDWRLEKAITDARDEHQDCYADYAFATAGAAEAIHFIEKKGKLGWMSPQ